MAVKKAIPKAEQSNALVNSLLIPFITALGEQGLEILLQKIVDKNKKTGTLLLSNFNTAITNVATANKITL